MTMPAANIRIVVAMHGSCNLLEIIPFEMNIFLVIPDDGFGVRKVDTSLIALA